MLTSINTFTQKTIANINDKFANTINGKLIITNSSELEEVKQLVEQINRKCDRLQLQQTMTPALPQSDSGQQEQINAIDLSLQKLRTVYSRIFWIVLVSSLGLNAANLLVLRQPSCAAEATPKAIVVEGDSYLNSTTKKSL